MIVSDAVLGFESTRGGANLAWVFPCRASRQPPRFRASAQPLSRRYARRPRESLRGVLCRRGDHAIWKSAGGIAQTPFGTSVLGSGHASEMPRAGIASASGHPAGLPVQGVLRVGNRYRAFLILRGLELAPEGLYKAMTTLWQEAALTRFMDGKTVLDQGEAVTARSASARGVDLVKVDVGHESVDRSVDFLRCRAEEERLLAQKISNYAQVVDAPAHRLWSGS